MESGTYLKVLIPIEFSKENKKPRINELWKARGYRMSSVFRKARGAEPETYSGLITRLVHREETGDTYAIVWLKEEFRSSIESKKVRISWDLDSGDYIEPYLSHLGDGNKALVEEQEPDAYKIIGSKVIEMEAVEHSPTLPEPVKRNTKEMLRGKSKT